MSKGGSITKGTKSSVYVLTRYVDGRPTLPYDRDVAVDLMREAAGHECLCATCQERWDAYEDTNERNVRTRRAWGIAFLDALDKGAPMPRRRGAPLDPDADYDEMTSREAVLVALYESAHRGLTGTEASRKTGITGGPVAGGLSEMHEAGLVARLDVKR